jgi:hypothetical protein
MAERDSDPMRQQNADRGDAMNEPDGVDQEHANALDVTALPPEGLATPAKPEIAKPEPGRTPPGTMGSPAADPQQVR